MARFDVFANPGSKNKKFPYLLDVQSNHLNGLATRVVIPLRTLASFGSATIAQDLCPILRIAEQDYFLDTPLLAAIPTRELRQFVMSIKEEQPHIVAALDRLFGAH